MNHIGERESRNFGVIFPETQLNPLKQISEVIFILKRYLLMKKHKLDEVITNAT